MKNSYVRPEIFELAGYTPGEQPKVSNLIKLNTNENPYPPSPAVGRAAHDFAMSDLRRYPNPTCDMLRSAVAEANNISIDRVIAGNGSDDLLTMIFRTFADPGRAVAAPEPTYSLYPVLAAMQGAEFIRIPLEGSEFKLPADFSGRVSGANLLLLARPNAPTGTTYAKDAVRDICRRFDGIAVIDEAYADFAEDNCLDLAAEFDNVIVTRTFSKSYSLAGLRLGYAVSSPDIISQLMKLKDSYNVDALTQALGTAAYCDREYLAENCRKICRDRSFLQQELLKLGFEVPPSQGNFVFAAPPDNDGERYFKTLREKAVIVRYFPGPVTGRYVRITIGTPEELAKLLDITRELYS